MKMVGRILSTLIIGALTLWSLAASAEEQSLTGVVVDAGMNGFTLEVAPNTRLNFSVEQSQLDTQSLTQGLIIGKVVQLSYTGTIDFQQKNTSLAQVVSVADGQVQDMIYRTESMVDGVERPQAEALQLGSGYLVWYDTDFFVPSNDSEAGNRLLSTDENLDLSMEIQMVDPGEERIESILSELEDQFSAENYTLTPADCSVFPEEYLRGGWICNKEGRELQVFVVSVAAGAPLYRITLSYPQESAANLQPRITDLLSSFRLL